MCLVELSRIYTSSYSKRDIPPPSPPIDFWPNLFTFPQTSRGNVET